MIHYDHYDNIKCHVWTKFIRYHEGNIDNYTEGWLTCINSALEKYNAKFNYLSAGIDSGCIFQYEEDYIRFMLEWS